MVDVDSKDEARNILPPGYRREATIVQLNKFGSTNWTISSSVTRADSCWLAPPWKAILLGSLAIGWRSLGHAAERPPLPGAFMWSGPGPPENLQHALSSNVEVSLDHRRDWQSGPVVAGRPGRRVELRRTREREIATARSIGNLSDKRIAGRSARQVRFDGLPPNQTVASSNSRQSIEPRTRVLSVQVESAQIEDVRRQRACGNTTRQQAGFNGVAPLEPRHLPYQGAPGYEVDRDGDRWRRQGRHSRTLGWRRRTLPG